MLRFVTKKLSTPDMRFRVPTGFVFRRVPYIRLEVRIHEMRGTFAGPGPLLELSPRYDPSRGGVEKRHKGEEMAYCFIGSVVQGSIGGYDS